MALAAEKQPAWPVGRAEVSVEFGGRRRLSRKDPMV